MTEFYCANFTAAKKVNFSRKRKVENSNEELVNKKVRQIVPITPESIAEFLEGQGDFTKPHQLCENEFNFQRKDYVQGNTTDSGRAIEWIPLRRLEVSESAELFSEVIRSLNLEHRLFIIKKCLADCNGHPRTLENFYQVFNSNEEAKKIHNYSSLIAILTNHIGEWYKHISFPVVKMALLEKSVRLSDIINTNGEQLSISALISSGTYINLLTEKSEAQFVIPTLLPISLQYFCLNNKDDGDAQTATIILQKLLTMESSFDDEVMDGKPFERFHAN
ncbi:hypothetical protein RhiirA5_395612 [Rhizophagus irregularis]|uniref:Uncharacterized protein n=1 Tax=Rhizophagus irregularis TaxID=588596 RepID=A0A2I1F508_9GLOM|nr:hypothetical protein RhiirA5_395612 [Rhizophagus irregularis]PKY29461.1 hypothetical protein RhiirB3_474423 [Rhizophagus irregularis]